jgi:hypothetical protein
MNVKSDAAARFQRDLRKKPSFPVQFFRPGDKAGQLYRSVSVTHMFSVFHFTFILSSDHDPYFLPDELFSADS